MNGHNLCLFCLKEADGVDTASLELCGLLENAPPWGLIDTNSPIQADDIYTASPAVIAAVKNLSN